MLNLVYASGTEGGGAMVNTPVESVNRQDSRPTEDSLAVEEPLEIQPGCGPRTARRVKSISVTMRTPGCDFELAAGFPMTEGVVRDLNDIDQIVYASENEAHISQEKDERASILPYQLSKNIVRVDLGPQTVVSLANLERNLYATSSCGVCGKASLLALRAVCPARMRNAFSIEADLLYDLPPRLRSPHSTGQGVYMEPGCLMRKVR
jgi:FdhD protein